MRLPLAHPMRATLLPLGSGLILFLLAAGALLLFEQTAIRVVSGSLLYFLLPGYFLALALLPKRDWLEVIGLAIAGSTALSTLTILLVMLAASGVLTLRQVWSALALLTTLTFCLAVYQNFRRHKATAAAPTETPTVAAPCVWWWLLLLVLLLAATLRLAYLDHAELQDDEIDITNVAVRILSGEDSVVFADRRGPAQTVITAVAYAFGERPSEWILRLPAVITALAAIALIILLASHIFNRWIGLLSGLLFSLEGFALAYGRIVQMQSTLLLMMVATIYCFYQLYRAPERREALLYQALGTLFFGFGILAHYEMALLAPVMLFLYVAKYQLEFWQRDKWGILLAASILLLTTGSFYLAFFLNPAFDETLAYYRDEIVGRAINNNSTQFVLVALFYNSIYLFAALYLGATIALIRQLRLLLHRLNRLQFLLLLLGFLGIVGGTILWGGAQSNAILFTLALIVAAHSIVSPRLPLVTRLLFLWFAIYFIPYVFLLREVHIHYYAFSPPLAILAAYGWYHLYQRGAAQEASRKVWQPLWTSALVALVSLSSYYAYLVFVQPMPEYALTFPNAKHALYPTPYATRQGEAFGFQHRSGWQTVAWLYRTGTLRGSFETNELWLKPQWYTKWQNAGETPRYYLIAAQPHRLQASPWPEPMTPEEYHLWGVVTVQGQPRLHIYERNAFAPPAQPYTFADEEMAAQLDAAQTIDELYRAEQSQADPDFYRQAAQQLATKADAPLLIYAPEQSEILSLYDESNRRYLMPSLETGASVQAQAALLSQITAQGDQLHALYWGVDALPTLENLHTRLNQQLFLVSDEWIGNLRLITYDVPPADSQTMIQSTHSLQVGSAIMLLGYTLQRQQNLHLSLFWRTRAPLPERYKVFVHLLNSENAIVSQQDGEPVGSQLPTSTWPVSTAESPDVSTAIRDNRAIPVPPEITDLTGYTLAFGMYDPATGERLLITQPDGTPLPDNMVRIALD